MVLFADYYIFVGSGVPRVDLGTRDDSDTMVAVEEERSWMQSIFFYIIYM